VAQDKRHLFGYVEKPHREARCMSDNSIDPRSVTLWIGDLQRNEPGDAVQNLWNRYFERLVNLARARLRDKPRRSADEEDVALSALDSFCRLASDGRFPRLEGRDDLWRLLVTITVRKANALVHRERRRKRGGGCTLDEAALAGADDGVRLAAVAGFEPTPDFAAEVADEFQRLLHMLGDDVLRRVALLRMEGHSNEQIAESLGCGLRSVERKLALIRKAWEREVD
jgi:DNA-directed RNA polymerase specialized sigma24 family protein